MEIKNKVVIVTGASMGIGKATAELLAQHGAKVVLAARSEDAIKKLEQQLPESFAVQTDMTDEKSVKNLINQTQEKYGRIDAIVNNAGQGMQGDVEHIDIESYQKILDLNVFGVLRAMQQVIPVMRVQGGGTIVNISSNVSKMYIPYLSAYSSTKHALNSLTLSARQELKKDNIIVSLMHPGLTATDFGKNSVQPKNAGGPGIDMSGMKADTVEMVAEKIMEALVSGKPETFMNEQAEQMAKSSQNMISSL